jgi:hypothetical protein
MKTFNIADLDQFYGSENLYRHAIACDVTYTDGVQFLAEKAGAYWLIDEIALMQRDPILAGEEFQVWHLLVVGTAGHLTCDDGDGKVIYEKTITYTDFPAPGVKLYVTGGVIMLPTEY